MIISKNLHVALAIGLVSELLWYSMRTEMYITDQTSEVIVALGWLHEGPNIVVASQRITCATCAYEPVS